MRPAVHRYTLRLVAMWFIVCSTLKADLTWCFFIRGICCMPELPTSAWLHSYNGQPPPRSTIWWVVHTYIIIVCLTSDDQLWCHSHLVWLVFEVSIPTCTCFPSENFLWLVIIVCLISNDPTVFVYIGALNDLTGVNRVVVPFLACGDLSGFDSDMNYPVQVRETKYWTGPRSKNTLKFIAFL